MTLSRLRRITLSLLLTMALSACGNSDAAQQRAFIAFLQTRIIDKPGLHVPRPTPEEAKAWPNYAAQYAIIMDFNDGVSQHVTTPMKQAIAGGAVTSLQDLVSRRGDLVVMRRGMGEIRTALNRQFATAEAAHAALSQPAELKAAFDAAYQRDVAGPAQAFQQALPVADDALAASIDVGNFLAQHSRQVVLDGAQVQVNDSALRQELGARLATMNAKAQAAQAAQQRLQSLVRG